MSQPKIVKRLCSALISTAFMAALICALAVCRVSNSQETKQAVPPQPNATTASNPDDVKQYPLYIGVVIHIEVAKTLDETKFKDVAAELRGIANVFKRNNAKLTMQSDETFALACAKYADNVLLEMEKKYGFVVGSYPHGNPAASAKAAVEALGVANRHVFGNWSKRNNPDWVADAKASGFEYTCSAQAMVLPEVEPPAPWDHETVPWSRADRLHPWRIKSSAEWAVHDPNSSLVYIPGESYGHIAGLYEKDLTDNLNRLLGPTALDSRDFDVAIEIMKKALVFAEKDKVNTWYLVMRVNGINRFDQKADLFDNWLKKVNQEFVKPGLVEWKTLDEMYDAYVEWEKAGSLNE